MMSSLELMALDPWSPWNGVLSWQHMIEVDPGNIPGQNDWPHLGFRKNAQRVSLIPAETILWSAEPEVVCIRGIRWPCDV